MESGMISPTSKAQSIHRRIDPSISERDPCHTIINDAQFRASFLLYSIMSRDVGFQ